MATFFDGASGALSEVAGFAGGAFHSAIENPYNGLVQIANKTTGAKIPELHVVDDQQHNLGFMAGNVVGMAADYFLLNKVGGKIMGNLGGASLEGSVLRAGITGGFYEGVLTPSNKDSNNFFGDRFGSTLVGATTFASMTYGGSLLGRTGLFLVPEARSLAGSMAFNGLTGAIGGVAHAEASAVFKEGKPFASPSQFLTDGLTYGAFGTAFGAMDYGYNRIANPLQVSTVKSDNASISLFRNQQGQLVKIETQQPSNNYDYLDVKTEAAKNLNGSWTTTSSKAYSRETGASWGAASKPSINSIEQGPSGAVQVTLQDGDVRTYNPNGKYELSTDYTRSEANYRETSKKMLEDMANNGIKDINGNVSKTIVNAGGTMSGGVHMDANGVVQKAFVSGGTNLGASMERTGPGNWKVVMGHSEYAWQGEINPVTAASGKLEALDFVPKEGQTLRFTPPTEGAAPEASVLATGELLAKTGQFVKFSDSFGYARVGQDGSLYMKASLYDTPSVNGQTVGMQEVKVNPGDKISLKSDVGDRFPVWQTNQPVWGKTLDNQLTLNGQILEPNTMIDIHQFRKPGN